VTFGVLSDFFIFCGTIVTLFIIPEENPTDDSLTAVITFESEAAAKTAILLSHALINDRPIEVEMAPPDFKPTVTTGVYTDGSPQNSEPSLITNIIDTGYQVGTDVVNRARALDEQTGVTQKINDGIAVMTSAVTQLDSQYQITETARQWTEQVQTKVKGLDEQWEISNKASEVGNQVGGFLSVATATAVSGAETAKVAVENFVDSNPQVAMGIDTVKRVTLSIGSSIESGFNSVVGFVEGTTNTGVNK